MQLDVRSALIGAGLLGIGLLAAGLSTPSAPHSGRYQFTVSERSVTHYVIDTDTGSLWMVGLPTEKGPGEWKALGKPPE